MDPLLGRSKFNPPFGIRRGRGLVHRSAGRQATAVDGTKKRPPYHNPPQVAAAATAAAATTHPARKPVAPLSWPTPLLLPSWSLQPSRGRPPRSCQAAATAARGGNMCSADPQTARAHTKKKSSPPSARTRPGTTARCRAGRVTAAAGDSVVPIPARGVGLGRSITLGLRLGVGLLRLRPLHTRMVRADGRLARAFVVAVAAEARLDGAGGGGAPPLRRRQVRILVGG